MQSRILAFFRKCVAHFRRSPQPQAFTEEQWQRQFKITHYGDFQMTNAVRPGPPPVGQTPRQGYRRDGWLSPEGQVVPYLLVAVSREQLFDTFLEMLEPLDFVVDVVLDTSHGQRTTGSRSLSRRDIDRPILESALQEYEQLLLHDGCTGLAVISQDPLREVQFCEHKLLTIFAPDGDLRAFERVLQRRKIRRDDSLRFITNGQHIHSGTFQQFQEFRQLCNKLGADSVAPWPDGTGRDEEDDTDWR